MATITSSGGISNAGSGSTTQSGSGVSSNDNNDSDRGSFGGGYTGGSFGDSSDSDNVGGGDSGGDSGGGSGSKQFDVGYSGNAVVAADGSLIATPGTEITQVGNEVNAGPGQITGAATVEETKQAVAEAGGDPAKVGELVKDPSADSAGPVLDLKSEISSAVEEAAVNQTIANTVGSVTQDRPSPLADEDEPDSDSGSGMTDVTNTVVGDGDGGSDYSITGTVDEDVSDADNTGPQTVPGVPPSAGDGAGGSSVLGIVGAGGIVALIGVVGYLMTQQ